MVPNRMPSGRLYLLRPLASAQEKIHQQIARGERLLTGPIPTDGALREAEAERDRWTDFNIELMKQILSGPEYSDGYQKFHSSISYTDWGLAEKRDLFWAVVAEQLNQLKSDLERLELIPEAETEKTAPERTPPAPGITNVFHGPVGNVAQESKHVRQTASHGDKTKAGLSTEAKIALVALVFTIAGVIAAWLTVPGFLK